MNGAKTVAIYGIMWYNFYKQVKGQIIENAVRIR